MRAKTGVVAAAWRFPYSVAGMSLDVRLDIMCCVLRDMLCAACCVHTLLGPSYLLSPGFHLRFYRPLLPHILLLRTHAHALLPFYRSLCLRQTFPCLPCPSTTSASLRERRLDMGVRVGHLTPAAFGSYDMP